ncbi:efflux RND transporter periplasmic adaptor subunit [Inhella sp.]|uniref:efflux RND transporter periplasmic adaptor subunit n=1 Tax=Inhella sp. TaxID=1921806 RepID=UPI0035ADEFBE
MPNPDLSQLLGEPPRRRRIWLLLPLLGLGLALLAWALWPRAAQAPRYQTAQVTRGALTVTISATGTVQPTKKVNVGSELSGTVARVLVDLNDRVQRGQLLAELDSTRLREQVAGARAALAAARASLRQAEATQAETQAALQRQLAIQKASGGQLPAAQELEAVRAAQLRAQAQAAAAQAQVLQAEAALRADESNLRKTALRAPIDGVVLARAVDPGNAVAASLQAVTLFTLAEDLRSMKLDVAIDEADVGQVREGQAARFSVSAYPQREYPAQVRRVGYGPTTKDNVTTYLAELTVDNADLSLRPGMTATAWVTTAQRQDVLLVPNAALRFSPPAAKPEPSAGSDVMARLMPRPPRAGASRAAGTDTRQVRQLWVLQDGQPRAVPVRPGVSDGRQTEVMSDELKPGMAVITGLVQATK